MFTILISAVTGYGLLTCGTLIAIYSLWVVGKDLLNDLRERKRQAQRSR